MSTMSALTLNRKTPVSKVLAAMRRSTPSQGELLGVDMTSNAAKAYRERANKLATLPALCRAEDSNIWLFRHLSEDCVIVSGSRHMDRKTFFEHVHEKLGRRFRPDAYRPFCVLTGISDPKVKKSILEVLQDKTPNDPVRRSHDAFIGGYVPWRPTSQMERKVAQLCSLIYESPIEKDVLNAQFSREQYRRLLEEDPNLVHLIPPTNKTSNALALQLADKLTQLDRGSARYKYALKSSVVTGKRIIDDRVARALHAGRTIPLVGDVVKPFTTTGNKNGSEEPSTMNNALNGIAIVRSSGMDTPPPNAMDHFVEKRGLLPVMKPWTIYWEHLSMSTECLEEKQKWHSLITHRILPADESLTGIPGLTKDGRDLGHIYYNVGN